MSHSPHILMKNEFNSEFPWLFHQSQKKKRKAWSIIQTKKIILCLKFYCSSLFTNDSAILCFFFPPNLPTHPLDRACMTCIRPKRKMSVLLLWSQFIIMIKIHETFNQNQLFCLPCLKFFLHHRSKLSLTCGLTSSGCKNLFDKQDNLSLRQW